MHGNNNKKVFLGVHSSNVRSWVTFRGGHWGLRYFGIGQFSMRYFSIFNLEPRYCGNLQTAGCAFLAF